MAKLISIEEAVKEIEDGMKVMIGGFMSCGVPEKLIDGIIEKGVKDLTVICNDTGFPEDGIGKLIAHRRVKKLITSHIGTNPQTGKQMTAGEIEVDLVPRVH
jgi:acetate CoA/acetoacetate CoA-transferase alpha subunit